MATGADLTASICWGSLGQGQAMAVYVNAVNMERRPRGLPGAPLLVAGGLA